MAGRARPPRKRLAAPTRGRPPPRARGGSDPSGREQTGHSGRDTLSREPGAAARSGRRPRSGSPAQRSETGGRERGTVFTRTASSRPSARGEPAEVAVQTSERPARLPSTSESRGSPPLLGTTTAAGTPAARAGFAPSARLDPRPAEGLPPRPGERFPVAGMGCSRGVCLFWFQPWSLATFWPNG